MAVSTPTWKTTEGRLAFLSLTLISAGPYLGINLKPDQLYGIAGISGALSVGTGVKKGAQAKAGVK